MIVPSRDEFARLAHDHDVVPGGARGLRGPHHADIGVHGACRGGRARVSARERLGGERMGRYSFLGVGDRETITAHGDEVVVENGGVVGERAADPLTVVERRLSAGTVARVPGCRASSAAPSATSATRSPRVRAGAPPRQRRVGVPDMAFMLADIVVAFDHARRVMQVIAPVRPGAPPSRLRSRARAHRRGTAPHRCGPAGSAARRGGRERRGATDRRPPARSSSRA
jgi:anthranilate synthase component I